MNYSDGFLRKSFLLIILISLQLGQILATVSVSKSCALSNFCCPCEPVRAALIGCNDECIPGEEKCKLYQNNCAPGFTDLVLDRTYIRTKDEDQNKSFDDCVFPDIDITIDKEAMIALLPIGSQRLTYTADTSETMIDVGMASEDTQFWSIPSIAIDNIQLSEIIDTSLSPFKDSFADVTRVLKSINTNNPNNEIYNHYKIDDDEMLLLGVGLENEGDPYSYHSFAIESDFPLQCGLTVDSRSAIITSFNNDIDSTVEIKTYVVRATGMMKPINEEVVPTLLAEFTLSEQTFKDGQVVDERNYEGFEWFSTKGHRITGILKPGAPKEGMTTFINITYQRSLPACPQSHVLGTDLVANTYRAQDTIQVSSNMIDGPINLIAGQHIDLLEGFTTSAEISAVISAMPCAN